MIYLKTFTVTAVIELSVWHGESSYHFKGPATRWRWLAPGWPQGRQTEIVECRISFDDRIYRVC